MAKDAYKYFRVEARELLEGLTQGVLQHEKGTAAPDVVARLLRMAHTLKGAARVVKQPGIAELAHTVEGILTSHREAGRPLSTEQGSELLRLLDEITSRLKDLEPASDVTAASPVRPAAEEPLETLRVEIQEMDSLLRGVTEAGVQLGAVRKGLGAVDRLRDLTSLLLDDLGARPGENGAGASPGMVRARFLAEEMQSSVDQFQRSLAVDVERVEGEFAGIRDVADRLRLIPAHSVFPTLDRAVRDAAHALGKRVDFEASGGEVRLDANVLASLRDALMHVVRNAVAHGAETEVERVAAGKSPTGHVRLAVERRGTRVAFVCIDDGRGIDVEAVRKAAVAQGLVRASEAKSLPADKVIALLRAGGLTTSNDVTELSGRGIGLDVVRATTSRLKGELSIRSEAGLGATVEVQVPVSIASLHGLVVEAGGALAAIPLDAIRQTLRVRDIDVSRSAERDSILHEGKVIPFLPLDRMLQRSGAASFASEARASAGGKPASANRNRRAWSAVVVHAGDRSVAVGVDRLLGTSNIVMRSLPGVVEADPVVSGASLDAEGNPQLVLDPIGLVGAAERGRGAVPDEAAPRRAPVLVIDDSLTTRMLEQSILESAGYEVELAVSAEEALSKSRDRRYSLFIVDVEMPGMDGFEFVAQTRSDSALRDIPAILVTSRNATEDRRRGEQVGARAYIVKGEFDQGELLQTIRTLIG
jgi:two-component system chemotaxis sensor kinase CheA